MMSCGFTVTLLVALLPSAHSVPPLLRNVNHMPMEANSSVLQITSDGSLHQRHGEPTAQGDSEQPQKEEEAEEDAPVDSPIDNTTDDTTDNATGGGDANQEDFSSLTSAWDDPDLVEHTYAKIKKLLGMGGNDTDGEEAARSRQDNADPTDYDVWYPQDYDDGHAKIACPKPDSLVETEDDYRFPVDVVYTWIAQPTQNEYQEIRKDCPSLIGGWQRFRNMHTFRFSLRMLEKNIPWVRKVFIVVGNKAPEWLNTSHPKVELIQQESLWPKDRLKTDLPIHNSQAVEVFLHRIPGLAKHFVYFNDDMFVGKPLDRGFFFTDRGIPVMHAGSIPRDHKWCHRLSPGSMPMNPQTHQSIPLTKKLVEDVQAKWPAVFANISASHCRGQLSANRGPTWLYGWYGIQSGGIHLRTDAKVSWLREAEAPGDAKKWYMDAMRHPPALGCINDDFSVNSPILYRDEVFELVGFLRNYSHGEMSGFENHNHWTL